MRDNTRVVGSCHVRLGSEGSCEMVTRVVSSKDALIEKQAGSPTANALYLV